MQDCCAGSGAVSVDGYTHEEFMAVSGLAPIPKVPINDRPLPIPYEQAVKAVAACQTLDEAKYFSDAADALSAWAKIYADDRVSREARALKLHAFRRVYSIAQQVVPTMRDPSICGRPRGPRFVMGEAGFRPKDIEAAKKLAELPQKKFDKLVNSARPPAPSTLAAVTLAKKPILISFNHKMGSFLAEIRALRIIDQIEEGLTEIEKATLLKRITELSALLGKVERQLRKTAAKRAVG